MLFTGKSDDQRQGITPSRSDVSWKIPLFHGEEGKVQRTLEMAGVNTRNSVRKGRRTLSEQRYSPNQGRWDSKKCQECKKREKKQGRTCPTFYYLEPNNVWIIGKYHPWFSNKIYQKQRLYSWKILLIITCFSFKTTSWDTCMRTDRMWQQSIESEFCGVFVCVAANMQFESRWNQEVGKEKDQQLNQQVSPNEKQQGIPNNTTYPTKLKKWVMLTLATPLTIMRWKQQVEFGHSDRKAGCKSAWVAEWAVSHTI